MKNAVVAIAGLSIQGVAPQSAVPGLLDEYGSDPSRIKDPTADAARKNKEAITAAPKAESNYEPNLRSNYYYPTNKKRYLPRIKKCNDAIPSAAALIGSEDWEGAEEFA